MKKILRMWIMGVLFFAMLWAMCLSCFGADVNYQQKNIEAGQAKYQLLDALCNEHYIKKPDTYEHSIKQNTCLVIQKYVDAIRGLMYSERAQTEDLSGEMQLIYKKGVAAGRLSWIYYSHRETANLPSVKSIYEAKLAVIDSAGAESFFDGGSAEACYTDLFQIIYTEKLKALAEDSDSDTVRAIINSAPASMGSTCKYDEIGSDGEDGGNYKAFYLSVEKSVTEQRNRDKTAIEVLDVFAVLYPEGDAESSTELNAFFNSLSTKNNVSDMNSLMSETVGRLLSGLCSEGCEYRNTYLSHKAAEVCERTMSADGEIASLSELFESHSLRLSAADAKDSLVKYANALAEAGGYGDTERVTLSGITDEFTGVGGELDRAADAEAVQMRLNMAKTRCVWFDIYLDATAAIRSYLGEDSDIEWQADVLYDNTVSEINKGNRSEGGDILSSLLSDTEKMNALIAEAEAESFRTAHKDILIKPDVGVSDKSDIAAALSDGQGLSDAAKALLSDILLSLGEKYKEAISEEIASHVKADGAQSERIAAAEGLVNRVSVLSAMGDGGRFELSELQRMADDILVRSSAIASLYDGYVAEYLPYGTSRFADEAKQTAKTAAEKIAVSDSISGKELSDLAILELLRLAALEKIYSSAEGYEAVPAASALLSSAEAELSALGDRDAILDYTVNRTERIRKEIRLWEIGEAEQRLCELSDRLEDEIEGYEYISKLKKDEILSSLGTLISGALADIGGAEDIQDIRYLLGDAEARLSELTESARGFERAACLAWVKDSLYSSFGKKEDYSSDNYIKILEIISSCEDALSHASDISEYVAIGKGGVINIEAVEDLLEEARRLSGERLTAELDRLMLKKYCYSAEGLASIREIYDHSLAELSALGDISDAPRAQALADERIALMRAVNFQKIYTEEGGLAAAEGYRYPEGYDMSSGYVGAVWAEGGIPSDALLYITEADGADVAELIKKAAKRGLIFEGSQKVDRDILKLLKRCYISAAVNIDLGGALPAGGIYRVSLLIPEHIDRSAFLGVIFLSDDGRVEFHPLTNGASVVEFDTTHFSRYYIVSAGTADLTPWIICLSIIVLCELAFVAILLVRKRKRQAGITLASFILPMALSVRVRNAGAEMAVSVLCGVAVVLSGLIAYLLYDELKYAKKKVTRLKAQSESAGFPSKEKPEYPTEDRKTEKTKAAEEAEPTMDKKDVLFEMAAEPAAQLPEDITEPIQEDITEPIQEDIPEKTEEQIPEDITEDIPEEEVPVMSSVSAEEADALMSDREVTEHQGSKYEDCEVYHGTKKAEINIDTISYAFEDGSVVTLNSLKELGLIPKNIGHVKILARGILDKKLTVVAQDFSRSAEKMILLTGGEPVHTYPSAERGGRSE